MPIIFTLLAGSEDESTGNQQPPFIPAPDPEGEMLREEQKKRHQFPLNDEPIGGA